MLVVPNLRLVNVGSMIPGIRELLSVWLVKRGPRGRCNIRIVLRRIKRYVWRQHICEHILTIDRSSIRVPIPII